MLYAYTQLPGLIPGSTNYPVLRALLYYIDLRNIRESPSL